MKHAVVQPILKKPNLDPLDLKSYRPISNLSSISKLIERLATNRFNHHISTHSLLPVNQSAYRCHHSTETAVVSVFNNIARSIDNNQISALVLLDMSAAFDTVDHAILMSVLEKRFGVQHEALRWFTSYSSNRTQSVYVGEDHTSPSTLHCGVPQGSVIGPAEYIVYTEELDSIIRPRKFDHHMYADDIQLLSVMSLAEVPQFRSKIENCILAVRDWCSSRRLTLNPDKTELIWFASISNFEKVAIYLN